MIFEDYTYTRQQLDLGVIITQEEISLYQSKNFVLKETEMGQLPIFNHSLDIPRYNVKSLFTNTIYRDCIACSDVGVSGYKPGDVVVILSIRDIMFFILTKVNWLAQRKFEQGQIEPYLPGRKVFTNEVSSISLEQTGEIIFRFNVGYYDNFIKFGSYSIDKIGRSLLIIGNDAFGELLQMGFDGSVHFKTLKDLEIISKTTYLDTEDLTVRVVSEDKGILYDVNNYVVFRVKDDKSLEETFFRLNPSFVELYLGKEKQCRLYYEAKNGKNGLIELNFNDKFYVIIDGESELMKVYSDENNLTPAVRYKELKQELESLRNWLMTHTHTGNLGSPTSPPQQNLPVMKDFKAQKVQIE
jgi:hypothetical protein